MFHLRGYIKKYYFIATLILIILLTVTTDLCIGNDLSGGGEMRLSQKKIVSKNRLTNITSSPSYIKFKLKDYETGQIINVLLENSELAYYLAGARYDKDGRISLPNNFDSFIENEYIPFLVKNEGGTKELSISDFPKNSAVKIQYDEKSIKEFLNQYVYPRALTLGELKVNSEEELINTYFTFNEKTNYGYLKKEYINKFNSNAAFISLLLDLNYDVGRMDISPILYIRKIE